MSGATPFEQRVLPLFEAGSARDWLDQARDVAFELGLGGGIVNVDMVRDRCPPPADVDGRIMGALFRRPTWECVGYAASSRLINNKRPIGQFRLVGADLI